MMMKGVTSMSENAHPWIVTVDQGFSPNVTLRRWDEKQRAYVTYLNSPHKGRIQEIADALNERDERRQVVTEVAETPADAGVSEPNAEALKLKLKLIQKAMQEYDLGWVSQKKTHQIINSILSGKVIDVDGE